MAVTLFDESVEAWRPRLTTGPYFYIQMYIFPILYMSELVDTCQNLPWSYPL